MQEVKHELSSLSSQLIGITIDFFFSLCYEY
jgi:hypothetical protein